MFTTNVIEILDNKFLIGIVFESLSGNLYGGYSNRGIYYTWFFLKVAGKKLLSSCKYVFSKKRHNSGSARANVE